MSIVGQAVKSTTAGCALCLALAVPTAMSATGAATLAAQQQTTAEVLAGLMAGDDPALSPAEPSTSSTGWLTGPPFNVPADALVVNTPGTDDTTLYPRIDPMRGDLETVIVVYPESLFPFISGNSGHLLPIFAPTYDQSVAVAVDHNLETMAGLKDASDKPYVVYTGYSQGAEAVGDAAEQAYADGLLDTASTQIVLLSDPRSPWGIKQWAADHFLVSTAFKLVGATPNGARNPADTGDLPVTSVIIDGDPVANFQWVCYRPLTSLVVDAAGYIAFHSNRGPESYAHLDQIADKEVIYSQDGNTAYIVYHADHPLTEVTEMAVGIVGIQLSDAQVDRLDEFNNWFYPLQQPSPERAAPIAPVTSTAPAPAPTDDEASATPAESADVNTLAGDPVDPADDPTPSPQPFSLPPTDETTEVTPASTPPTPAPADDEATDIPAGSADVDALVDDPVDPAEVPLPHEITRLREVFAGTDGEDAQELSEGTAPDSDSDSGKHAGGQRSNNPALNRVRSGAAGESAETTKDVNRGGNPFHKPAQQSSAADADAA